MSEILKGTVERPIIAVTGSAGKTTVKAITASILKQRWNVFQSGNVNNTVRNTLHHMDMITEEHQAVVLEYGMSYYGHIARHCKVIQPNISIITNIGTAHIGNFKGRKEELAKAKSELIEGMVSDGILILNGNDPNSQLLHTEDFQGTIIKAGIGGSSLDCGHISKKQALPYYADHINYVPKGMEFDCILDRERIRFFLPAYGEHNVCNAMLAIAACHRLGFTEEEIRTGLSQYEKPKSRLNVVSLSHGIVLIDDSFSANPNAMKTALDVLEALSAKGPAVAVLGGMEELGVYSQQAHEEVGQYVSQKPITTLYTYESKAKMISEAAVQAGFPSSDAIHCPGKNELYSHIKNLAPNTTILVKGARKLRMNEIINYIKVRYRIASK